MRISLGIFYGIMPLSDLQKIALIINNATQLHEDCDPATGSLALDETMPRAYCGVLPKAPIQARILNVLKFRSLSLCLEQLEALHSHRKLIGHVDGLLHPKSRGI